MRFKFCGDLDCPDWVLAEMMMMSKISVVKFKLMCDLVAKKIIGGTDTFEMERVTKYFPGGEEIDMKALLAAIHFIYTQSVKYDTEPGTLEEELQQLGLPSEHARQFSKSYTSSVGALCQFLTKQGLRRSHLVSCDWRIIKEVDGSLWPCTRSNGPLIEIVINYTKKGFDSEVLSSRFTVSAVKFRTMYNEVKRVLDKMHRLKGEEE